VNLVGITCIKEKGLQSKCQTVWFEKNKNSLNLKFKAYSISCPIQTRRDSIQASEIYSELLFMYCTYYSDTRGFTVLPLTEISSRDLEGVAALTDTVNNYTIPHYGKTKSGW
jgi:hypothetical protein